MTPFIRAITIRAARTAAQTALAALGAATLLTDVDWAVAGSTVGLATVASVLTSIMTGLPEVPEN